MRCVRRLAGTAALSLPLLLAGCNVFPTTRHLPVPKAPALVQTLTPPQLVNLVNQRWNALHTLTVVAEITATELKTSQGLEKDFPSCHGAIVISKPKMLRVAGTYFGVKIFDMASDGDHFTLVIPQKNIALEGPDTVNEKSSNPLENLRPAFFLDAIAVRGLAPDDEFMVTGDSETVEDAAKKHLYFEPEYVLSVMRRKTGQEIQPIRTITFHRDDMLPYDQYVYNSNGELETQVFYSNYATFSAGKYPSKIVIKRPAEGIQLVLNVERVNENVDLPPDEFKVKIPGSAKIQTLK
jgi:hypothetical protein